MNVLEEVREKTPVCRTRPAKKPIGLRLQADYLDALKRVAWRKGIPYQTLIQMWLVDKLRQEAPDLLPEHTWPRRYRLSYSEHAPPFRQAISCQNREIAHPQSPIANLKSQIG